MRPSGREMAQRRVYVVANDSATEAPSSVCGGGRVGLFNSCQPSAEADRCDPT